jgi:hypothetical protein
MKVTLESTERIIELQTPTGVVPARVWEGRTESGIHVHAYITRISVHEKDDQSEFERELQETRKSSVGVQAIPLRLIL